MSKQRTLIFFGAHPDDETFGVGATLAKYAAQGVNVYYVCATRGEAGTDDPEASGGDEAFGKLRWEELLSATSELGLKDVIYLGYRDSGMPGSEDNKHPRALAAAPLEEVTERIVKIIRGLKPEVVITFDPIGGYNHPDHIAIHKGVVAAFKAASDPDQFPEAGPPFKPQKLYYHFFPHKLLKLAVRVMPLFGKDPRKFGRNKDIDLAAIVEKEFPIHAEVSLSKKDIARREGAANCYVSQIEGGRRHDVLSVVLRLFGQHDVFTRAYPEPGPGEKKEKDLFQGVV